MQRFIPVKFSVRGRDLGSTVAEAQERIAKNVKLPSGYRLVWAGEFGDLQKAKKRLEVIVPVSLVLILGLLYCLFNSLRDCLLTLAGHPFRHGRRRIWRSIVSGLHFSISAAIGFVSLFGVSVMNGILLITYYNQARLRGMSARGRHVPRRLHPHAAAADDSLSACIGLLPAAISTGIGSQVQRPLATVIVGGMLFGPLMLLLVCRRLEWCSWGRMKGRGRKWKYESSVFWDFGGCLRTIGDACRRCQTRKVHKSGCSQKNS